MSDNHFAHRYHNNDARAALRWLRAVVMGAVEVAALPLWLKRRLIRFIPRPPDWLMDSWASALNIDYGNGFKTHPYLAEHLRRCAYTDIVHNYLETHRVVSTARRLRQVVSTAIALLRRGELPISAPTVLMSATALSLATCTPLGKEFIERTTSILGTSQQTDHLLGEYQLALEHHDVQRLEDLHGALTSCSYGEWIAQRIREAKQWLEEGGKTELNVRWEIDTLPDNGGIYQILLKGGKNDES